MNLNLGHRNVLFSFLGDPMLGKDQRAIGMVMILMTEKKRNFRTADRPVDWEKVALLAGYGERTCRRVFGELIAAGWLEKREDKMHAYQIARTRLAIAVAKLEEHMAVVRAAQSERDKARQDPAKGEAANAQ